MKLKYTVLIILIFLLSCNDTPKPDPQQNNGIENNIPGKIQTATFFPVTDFINGQIAEIKKNGINPLKITSSNNRYDTVWLKIEDLNNEFSAFLSPVIDSTNLAGMFKENSFLDQTIDAITLTYEPIKQLPDSFLLQRWDIYIDPINNTVRRIYLVKKTTDQKILQLTWQTNKSCKIVSISNDSKGNGYVEKEVNIKWDL
jgi:hypothetical protein